MSNEHPITPPPELVKQWWKKAQQADYSDGLPCWLNYVATQAARWGSDQELEACCEWVESFQSKFFHAHDLRLVRRPKPPSLKEQALKELEWVDKNLKMPLLNQCTAIHTIRCALEQLDD